MTRINQLWRLAGHPRGVPSPADFVWCEEALPAVQAGELLIRTIYLSIDPSSRLRLDTRAHYGPGTAVGAVVPGRVLGMVEQSRHPQFQPGDLVQGSLGWQRYAVAPGSEVVHLVRAPATPLSAYLALLGHIGLTAYVGLLDIGQPRPGETLVVSAAAGAVGSIAGQIGKLKGCRVVGVAGGSEKCRWLTDSLGFDAALNYKDGALDQQLAQACPAGIDLFFDNVGGALLDAVLAQINTHARIIVCGLIAQYNASGPVPGPYNFGAILTKRARVEGFLNFDHQDRLPACLADLGDWLRAGKLQYHVETMQGLAQAPAALIRLFSGSHLGKLVVQVSDEPAS